MFKNTIHFIKYNNLAVFILLGFFLVGSSVFAQTEAGQEVIGSRQVTYEGVDNTLLLEADLDSIDMDFSIERIEQDKKYYFITYTYINLERIDNVWQYQMREKKRKVSKKIRVDLGIYLAEELAEEYEARVKELKEEQLEAEVQGESVVTEVTEYDGLIGRTLEIAGSVFTGYTPVKRERLPSPSVPLLLTMSRNLVEEAGDSYQNVIDDISNVYDEYMIENDPDEDGVLTAMDNCPYDANPDQFDIDEDGMGNVCDPNPDNYDSQIIIEEPVEPIDPNDGNATSTEDNLTGTSTEEVATTTEEVVEENNGENATSTEVIIEETPEEPEVEIIELPIEGGEGNTTEGTGSENSGAGNEGTEVPATEPATEPGATEPEVPAEPETTS